MNKINKIKPGNVGEANRIRGAYFVASRPGNNVHYLYAVLLLCDDFKI